MHLLSVEGVLIAGVDDLPQGGANPTWSWQPGEMVADRAVLNIPSGTPPGIYRLSTGLYDLQAASVRLPVRNEHGQLSPDAEVLLSDLDVQPGSSLQIGYLIAQTAPHRLGQDGVFRDSHIDCATGSRGITIYNLWLAPVQLLPVKGPALGYNNVDLEHSIQVDHIAAAALADRLADGAVVEVELARQKISKWLRLLKLRSATISTSNVVRTTPWIVLASEPPTTQVAPTCFNASITCKVTAMGSSIMGFL